MSDDEPELDIAVSSASDLALSHSGAVSGAVTLLVAFNVDGALDAHASTLRIDARILVGLAITYAVRWIIHVGLGYLRMDNTAERRLAAATWADLFVLGVVLVFCARAVGSPTLGRVLWAAGLMVGLVAISAGVTMLILTGSNDLCNKKRGTAWVASRRPMRALAKLLRTLDDIPPLSAPGQLLRVPTGIKVSVYVTTIVLMPILMSCGIAAGYIVHQDRMQSTKVQFIAQVLHPAPLTVPPKTLHPAHKPPAPRKGQLAQACANYVTPGAVAPRQASAPEGVRAAMSRVFETTLGTNEMGTGCPWVAHHEVRHPSLWWETGWCGRQLESLATTQGGATSTLYGQAAALARYLAMRGLLNGATPLTRIGTGDVQLIATRFGTVAAVREFRPQSSALRGRIPMPCRGSALAAAPSVQLPPAMTVLWNWFIVQHRRWVWPVYDESRAGRAFDFVSGGPGGPIVARGACARNGSCSLTDRAGRRTQRPVSGLAVSLKSLERFAPKTQNP
jgi:hypothetical protein